MSGMIIRLNLNVSNRVEHFSSQWVAHSLARTRGCFTDLVLVPGVGEAGEVLVHRAVLLPLLPLLSHLTEDPLVRWSETPVVLLPDTDLDTLQRMVDLFYTGRCDISSPQQQGQVLGLMACLGLHMHRDRLAVDVTASVDTKNGPSMSEGEEQNVDQANKKKENSAPYHVGNLEDVVKQVNYEDTDVEKFLVKKRRGRPRKIVGSKKERKPNPNPMSVSVEMDSKGDNSLVILDEPGKQPWETIEDLENYINIGGECSSTALRGGMSVESESKDHIEQKNKDTDDYETEDHKYMARGRPHDTSSTLNIGFSFPRKSSNPRKCKVCVGKKKGCKIPKYKNTCQSCGQPVCLAHTVQVCRSCSLNTRHGEEGEGGDVKVTVATFPRSRTNQASKRCRSCIRQGGIKRDKIPKTRSFCQACGEATCGRHMLQKCRQPCGEIPNIED